MTNSPPQGPHEGQTALHSGAPLGQARSAMILVHGRGASAESILTLAFELGRPDFAYLAPQAAGYTWYPNSFLAPIASNEPGISSGMAVLAALLRQLEAAGIPAERTILLGFSQGACLASEFSARHARRYGGVVALSGGLIGPPGTPRDYAGSLDGTPVFVGCSDVDPHIPKARVIETGEVLGQLGGAVDLRIYPGMGHTVAADEIAAVQTIMDALG